MELQRRRHSRSNTARVIARRIVPFFALTFVGLIVLAMFLERQLIFFPDRNPVVSWNPPELRVEEVSFKSLDGTPLYGWYFHHETPRAAVVFAHGNGGNVSYWGDMLADLRDRRHVSVFGFDYRGYGKSQGSPSERGILDDARAARAWLARRAGVRERDVVLMGTSLGGAVMVDLAANDGCRGLILESTFTSLPDVAAHHYRSLPVRHLMRTRLDSLSKIGRYHGPLLQCHSTDDEIVPFDLGRRLFEAANEPKTFIELSRLGHNAPLPDEYYEAFDRFIDDLSVANTDGD